MKVSEGEGPTRDGGVGKRGNETVPVLRPTSLQTRRIIQEQNSLETREPFDGRGPKDARPGGCLTCRVRLLGQDYGLLSVFSYHLNPEGHGCSGSSTEESADRRSVSMDTPLHFLCT